jgi:hypothetical protein
MAVSGKNWTLITSHGAVVLWLAANSRSTMREIADGVCITERQVARIVADLAHVHMIEVAREGRCNVYSINPDAPLRHPVLSHLPLQKLLETLHVLAPVAAAAPTAALV